MTDRRTGESSLSGMSWCRVDLAGGRLAWCGGGWRGGSKPRKGRRQRAVAHYRCFLYSRYFFVLQVFFCTTGVFPAQRFPTDPAV